MDVSGVRRCCRGGNHVVITHVRQSAKYEALYLRAYPMVGGARTGSVRNVLALCGEVA